MIEEWRAQLLADWVDSIFDKFVGTIAGLAESEKDRLKKAIIPGAETDLFEFLLPRIEAGVRLELLEGLVGARAGEPIEQWMLDAERGDCEPIEAVLLPKGPTADIPENGTMLVRFTDHQALLAQARDQLFDAEGNNRVEEQRDELCRRHERIQELEALLAQERERVLKQVLALAPHELTCACDQGGQFDFNAHLETCPRRQLGDLIATLNPSEQGDICQCCGGGSATPGPGGDLLCMTCRSADPSEQEQPGG